jgi:hypothetical protein
MDISGININDSKERDRDLAFTQLCFLMFDF